METTGNTTQIGVVVGINVELPLPEQLTKSKREPWGVLRAQTALGLRFVATQW